MLEAQDSRCTSTLRYSPGLVVVASVAVASTGEVLPVCLPGLIFDSDCLDVGLGFDVGCPDGGLVFGFGGLDGNLGFGFDCLDLGLVSSFDGFDVGLVFDFDGFDVGLVFDLDGLDAGWGFVTFPGTVRGPRAAEPVRVVEPD